MRNCKRAAAAGGGRGGLVMTTTEKEGKDAEKVMAVVVATFQPGYVVLKY